MKDEGRPFRRQRAVRLYAAKHKGGDVPLTFKTSGGGSFKGVPSGSHIAVCDIVADIGIQPGSRLYPDPKHQVYIRFEIPAERVEFEKDGKKINGPAVIGNAYTASMAETANLRKALQAWRGKTFTDDEAEAFDISTILGKACMLGVVEKQVGDRIYSNISSIGPLPKGMAAPGAELPLVFYMPGEEDQLLALPNWIQEKIKNQLPPAEPRTYVPDQVEISDDEIPF